MSRTPTEADPLAEAYHLGWSAVTRLLRQGWSWSGHERGVALRGLGPSGSLPRFATVSHVAGFDYDDDGRALARLDFDGDGDTDLVTTARSGPRLRILRNESPPGRRLAILLRGAPGQRGAVGARVEVELAGEPGHTLVRGRRAGEGFLAQSSAWLAFGLGEAQVAEVRVLWPAGPGVPEGRIERFAGVSGPGRYVLEMGSGTAREQPLGAAHDQTPARPEELALQPPRPTEKRTFVLARPLGMPSLPIELADGREAVLFGVLPGGRTRGAGRPLLIHLWASWCAPCREELERLAGARDELEQAGLLVMALAPDEPEERAASQKLLEEIGWPHSAGHLSQATLDRLDALQGVLQDREVRMPLPTSLLIDAEGRIDSLHFGPLTLETLRAGLARMQLDPEQRAAAALPRPGRWRSEPGGHSLSDLAGRLRRRGAVEMADELSRASLQLEQLSELELRLQVATARARQGKWEEAAGLFRKVTEVDRDAFAGWQGLGVSLHQLGSWEEARAAYREALRLDPQSVELRYNLGLIALELGELSLAERQAEVLASSADERAPSLAQDLSARLAARRARDGER